GRPLAQPEVGPLHVESPPHPAPSPRPRDRPWPTAMEAVVSRSRSLLEQYGPQAIGFYSSGQLFLEEYYNPMFHDLFLARAGDEWFMGHVDTDGSVDCWASYGPNLAEAIRGL
ncbi:hypothetical protein ACFTUC_29415, partial [Streptomyces sp. NPDC056944]